MSAQASLRIISDGHIDATKIDGGVGDQPVLSVSISRTSTSLVPELAYLSPDEAYLHAHRNIQSLGQCAVANRMAMIHFGSASTRSIAARRR